MEPLAAIVSRAVSGDPGGGYEGLELVSAFSSKCSIFESLLPTYVGPNSFKWRIASSKHCQIHFQCARRSSFTCEVFLAQ
jgi:hypothetical protein